MPKEEMGVPQEEVISNEEKIKAEEELKNKEGEIDPAEESVEKPSKIDSLKKERKGLREKIKETIKQRKEVKEGEEIYDKEDKEKIEKEREEAKERIDELFSEISSGIKNGENISSERQELFELGSKPELELAKYARYKLIDLKEVADDVFPNMIKNAKRKLDNFIASNEYAGDSLGRKQAYNQAYQKVKNIDDHYETALRKFRIAMHDLYSLEKEKK